MRNRIEKRKATTVTREIRAHVGIQKRDLTAEEKSAGYIGALAGEIPFNTDSGELRDRGLNRGKPFVERLSPDVFKRSLVEDNDIMGFAGHTDDPLAAFARIGENMTISASERSLEYRALVPDTQAGRDLLSLVDKKIIRGTSFEFSIRNDGEKWEKRGNQDIRTITEARLYAVNPVAYPAYPDSEVTAERAARRSTSKRGYWAYQDEDYLYADGNMTGDTAYAICSLGRETIELSEALDFIRDNPNGAPELIAYAKDEVTESAASVSMLVTFLSANGTATPADLANRAKEKLAEAREATKPAEKFTATESDHDRERRFRVLQLESS